MNDRIVGTRLAVAIGTIAVMAVLAFFAVSLLTRDTRQDIGVDEIANSQVPGFTNVQQDTPGVCGEITGCIQGARSTEAYFLRFDTRENAAAFAAQASDRYQSNWIVIEYRGSSMSQDDRDFLQDYINSLGNSD